jgi:radical SAM protein with 4Fe4S-binding SPASM domain
VDFMGATPSTHDWHMGAEGAFAGAVSGLRAAVANDLAPIAVMILTRRNVSETQAFVDLAAELGCRRVGILRLYPIGRARTQWPTLALPLADQMRAIEAIEVPSGIHLMTSWHPKDGNCCWQAAGVTYRGHSVGCGYLRDFVDFGDVREVGFMSTWRHPLAQRIRAGHVSSHCSECESSQGTQGGCRSTAFAFTGDWDAPDPFCTTMNGGTDVSVLPTAILPAGQ